ncbi:MAG: hypothetical protein U1D99_04115, partial [Candidatus Omnitrophota bacterium]|nr:hypothetical protein [Candidatus Omnitrophota bacterium]
TVLYLGLSPALVNSALSMYSEIAVYPFVLTIVLLTAAARVAGRSGRIGLVFLSGAGSGAFFFFATLVKGVFEGIAPCFLVAAVLQFRPHPRWTRSAIVFAAAALLVFYNGLSLYKAANLRHNGNYTLTNRGAWALYGNTARRTQVMDKQLLLAAVAYAPGEGFCKSLLDDEACRFWSAGKSDEFGFNKLKELESRGLSGGTLDKELLRLSVRKAGEAPLQYGFFGFLEAAKMLFWETTKLGFVTYPVWLEKLFDTVWLKNGLRLLMGILTLAAIVFAAVRLWTGRRKQEPGGENELIYPVLLMVLFFAAFHAPFFVLTRYILPLAPLYLVLIAVLIDSCFNRRS